MGPEARALTLVTSILTVFGLATLYSASSMVAMEKGFASTYYFSRQAIGVGAGLLLFAIAAKVDAERLRKFAWPLMGLTIVLLLVTVLPFTESIAPRVNGSRRFVIGTSIQPTELGKLAVVAWTAMLIVKKGEDGLRRLTKGLLPFLLVIGTLDVIAVFQPDLSVALMYTLVMGIMLFAGGARIGHFVVLAVVSIPILWPKMERLQYAIMRVTSFFDPGNAPEVLTYQLKQSLIAVGSGGPLGVGFGQGRQQYGFIPMGINDFVASNIGEEWGFMGLTLLVMAFAAYTYLGMRIARQARSQFQQLVAIGLTITMAMTAYLHIGVVIGLLPTTGLTLPFVSYGRSNLVLSFLLTGILVNMGSSRERVHHARATDPLAAPA
jgi:cell division protein FtsW